MSRLKKMLAAVGGAAIAAVALSAAGWPEQGGARAASHRRVPVALENLPANADNRSAFQAGSGQVVVDRNNGLVKIEQTPGGPARHRPPHS
jgi:hypothetical protein